MANIAVVGASGYSGAELVRILSRHPDVESLHLFASTGGEDRRFETEFPHLRQYHEGPILPFRPEDAGGLDAAFLALPHGASAEAASRLVDRVGVVIDLSGDLRIQDPAVYETFYGFPQPHPALARRAVYGLPEQRAQEVRDATLVSNPGCYPTASSLALLPALEAEGLCGEDVVVTAMSGSSGAGRSPKTHLMLSELHGNAWAYKLGAHQHAPEINQTLSRAAGRDVALTFVPQVIPVERGILAVATAPLKARVSSRELQGLYEERYRDCPFVRLTGDRSPSLREVAGTNFCDVAVVADASGSRLIAVAAIDNLIKGAAGQAVQNWNLTQGRPETAGLLEIAS